MHDRMQPTRAFQRESNSAYSSLLGAFATTGLDAAMGPTASELLGTGKPAESAADATAEFDELFALAFGDAPPADWSTAAGSDTAGVVEVSSERIEAADAEMTAATSDGTTSTDSLAPIPFGDLLPLAANEPLIAKLEATAVAVPVEPSTEALDIVRVAATAAPAADRLPQGWVPSGRRASLDSTRAFTATRPRYKTALRAANQFERRRWLAGQLTRVAGLALLALALVLGIGLGCAAHDNQGLYVDGTLPSGQSTYSRGANATNSTFVSYPAADAAADSYGLAESQPTAADEPLVVERSEPTMTTAPTGQPQPTASMSADGRTHIVVRGETLFSIAREYFGDASRWRDIAAANGLTRESTIYAGQELHIPADGTTASYQPTAADVPAAARPSNRVLDQAAQAMHEGRLRAARGMLSAKLYELSGPDEAAALTLLAQLNTQLLGDTGPDGDCRIHVVERGENLYRISRTYSCTWQSIAKLNRLRDTRILPGQQLLILKGSPRLLLDRQGGYLDLWLDEHFIKRYAVQLGSTNSVPIGSFRISRKIDSPPSGLGSRVVELNTGSLRLHGGSGAGIVLESAELEELYDIVMVNTEIRIR